MFVSNKNISLQLNPLWILKFSYSTIRNTKRDHKTNYYTRREIPQTKRKVLLVILYPLNSRSIATWPSQDANKTDQHEPKGLPERTINIIYIFSHSMATGSNYYLGMLVSNREDTWAVFFFLCLSGVDINSLRTPVVLHVTNLNLIQECVSDTA